MNFIKHFIEWMDFVAVDERLTPHHVSLYIALFQSWNLSHFRNPISISRQQIMQISKIGSVNTYSKCIKELDTWGYLEYIPSYNPIRGSKVYMYSFDKADDKADDTGDGQLKVKELRPSLNIKNNTNRNKKIKELTKQPVSNQFNKKKSKPKRENPDPPEDMVNSKREGSPKIHSSTDKSKNSSRDKAETTPAKYTWVLPVRKQKKTQDSGGTHFIPPEESTVISFFQNEPPFKNGNAEGGALEGRKFFNYFQSVGWKVGKNKPMKDWQAAARNWILNAKAFSKQSFQSTQTSAIKKSSNLHVESDKDYGEPL